MEDKNETFRYNYSANQQAEINEIREKYLPKDESKMEQLRKLDASTTKPGMITSVIIGIVGVLLFGQGMTWTVDGPNERFVWGIVIGVIGLGIMALASPVYRYMTKKRREKVAPQILKLTEELSNPEQ